MLFSKKLINLLRTSTKLQTLPKLHFFLPLRGLKCFFFIAIFSLPKGEGWGGVFAQDNQVKIDSLHAALKKSKEDTSKVNTLTELVFQLNSGGMWDKILPYIEQSLTLSQKLKYPKGLANTYRQFAFYYYFVAKDESKALDYMSKSLKIAETLPDKRPLYRVNNLLGDYYGNKGDFAKCLDYRLKVLKIAEAIGDKLLIIGAYRSLGGYYNFTGDLTKSSEYAIKALKIAEKLQDKEQLIASHEQLGMLYSSLTNYPLAKSHYLKQLALTDSTDIRTVATIYNNLADMYIRQKTTLPDSVAQAIRYIDKALALLPKGKFKGMWVILTTSKGEVYILEKNYPQALKLLFEALKLNEEVKITTIPPYIYNVIGNIYSIQGDNAQALAYYQRSLKASVGEKEVLLQTYEGLRNAYSKQKDFANAFQYQENYYALKDSLFNTESKTKTEAMRAEYNLEKQNDKIALLEKDKTLQAARNERTTLFLILALVLVGGVVLFAFYLARLNQKQKKTNRLLHEKNEEITQQSEELQQQAEELHQQAEELAAQRDSLEKANENVLLLSEIGKKITASLQFESIFGQLYENINQLMDATIFGVGIYQEDKQLINYELAMEKGIAYLPYTRSMQDKQQLPVQCIEQKKEILINDLSQEGHHFTLKSGAVLADGSKSEEPQSLIYIPLLNNQEKVLGIITVQSFQKDAYNDYHLNILRNLAIYTSIAIENAENLQALDEEKKNLEGKNQELEALTEELRQQSDMVQLQRDQLSESSTQLEELLEETQSQKEIVELKNQEMEALQSTKDLMISAVNHDLRNPLNPILNYSQPDYPKFTEKERLAMIHDRAKMMFALINDIMDVYRADKLQLQPQTASLHRAVSEAIAAISEAKTDLPEIINEVPENAVGIFEFKYIERVLENLLSNAIKYSENKANGGRIIFRASPLPPPLEGENLTPSPSERVGERLNSPSGVRGSFWRLSVQDNGMGIPKEKFEEIFLPFTNPNAKDIGAAKSVGIGLTFCKTIVEAHHSQILIESEVGKGTTFAFDLPMVEELLAHTTDNQSNGELQLNETSKAYLAEFVPQLVVFQDELFNADVRKVLKSIEANGNGSIHNWKQQLEQSIDEMDKERFKELLEMVAP